jgi:hypothetical protein
MAVDVDSDHGLYSKEKKKKGRKVKKYLCQVVDESWWYMADT